MRGSVLERWLESLTERWVRPKRLRPWRDAACLADLGELTARWLEGTVLEQPAYYGPVDVDEDMAPGLTAALIVANRAGLLTENSQAGVDQPAWRQLAWVSGRATPGMVHYLASAAEGRDDVEVVAFTRLPDHVCAGAATVRTEAELVVTWVSDGLPFTVDSRQKQSDYHWLYEGLVRPSALAEFDEAVQVAVVDPVPGRNTLWAWLEGTLRHVNAWPSPPSGLLTPSQPVPTAATSASSTCESCRRRPAVVLVDVQGAPPFSVCAECAPTRRALPPAASSRLPRQGVDVVRTASGLAVSAGTSSYGFHRRAR